MKLDEARHDALRALVAGFGLPWREEAAQTLHQALTHASYAKEHPGTPDNERLELLGDSVIALAVTEELYRLFPDEQEGDLSKRRHAMVSRRTFGRIGTEMGLGALLILNASGEDGNIRENANVLGSTLEAVMGAFYLHYEWGMLRDALHAKVVLPALAISGETGLTDYKTLLQQECHARRWPEPVYSLVRQSGPAHQREMTIEVTLGPDLRAEATALRKRDGEQEAARLAIEQLRLAK